ncbi:hypothetical protein V6Z12_A08G095700 [Gossypium hirsutum]
MTASKCILFIYFLLFSFVKSGYKKPRNCTCKFTHTHTEYTLQIHYLYTRIEKREKRFKINRGRRKIRRRKRSHIRNLSRRSMTSSKPKKRLVSIV